MTPLFMNSRIFILLFTICSFVVTAQNTSVQFCNYLYSNKNFDELQLYCQTLLSSTNDRLFEPKVKDSIAIFWVRARLKTSVDDSTIQNIQIQSLNSQLAVLKIYQKLYINDIQNGDALLKSFSDSLNDSVSVFFVEIFRLLRNKEYERCEIYAGSNKVLLSKFKEQILLNKLTEIIEFTKTIKKKSAFKGALYSCFFPGYGKKYAGLTGEAVSALLTNGVLGVVFAENIYRKGLKSPFTIGTGMLFTTFYISNIVGSYYAVKRSNLQQERIVDEKICTTLDFWVDSHFE